MAYGRFTGYQPVPDLPGAYSFQTAGGAPMTFGGPEAEQLKARLDAADKATADQRVAGPGGGNPFNKSMADLQNTGNVLAEQGRKDLGLDPPTAPPERQGPGGELGYGMFVGPDGRIMRRRTVAGSAGVTKEQLEAADANAVSMRKGEQDVVQQGTPQDQDYLDARAEANIDERLALQQEGDASVAAGQDEAALAQRQFESAQRQAAEEAAREADLARKYERENQLYQAALKDHTSSKVDPNGRRSPVQTLLGAIAAAGGAYASVISKTPNFALEIVNSAIDRDIRAQEAEIKLKGEKANNMLSELRQRGLSVEQSHAAVKAINIQRGAAETAALRAKNAVPTMQAHFDKLDLAMQKGLMEANEQSRLASLDKVTRQTSKGFESPRAGSAGRTVVEEAPDQLGAAQKVQNLRKGEVEIAKEQAAAGKPVPVSAELRKVDQSLAGLSSDQKRLDAYGDDERPATARNRNVLARTAAKLTNFVQGEGVYENNVLTEKDKQFIQDFEGAKNNLVAAISVGNLQGAMQDGERKEMEAKVAAAGTVAELKRAQAWVRDRLERQREAAAANPGPSMTVEATK